MINKRGSFSDLENLHVSIKGEDVSESIYSIHIFQDLFNPVWQATVNVVDTVNSMSNNGYKVGDTVSFSLTTRQGFDTDGNYDFELVINEIGDRMQQGQNTITYAIHCIGEPMIKSQGSKICKHWKEKTIDEIVKEIAREELEWQVQDKPPNPEQHEPHAPYKRSNGARLPSKCDIDIEYIAPNVSPLNAIAYLMGSAIKDGNADFVFFTKDNRKFDFASLNVMKKRKPVAKFVQRPNFIRENGDIDKNKNFEFSHFVIDHFNYMNNISAGLHGNTLCTYDVFSKQWNSSSSGKHGKSVYKFMPKHEKAFKGQPIHNNVESWWSNRRQELFKANQNLLKIQTPGHVKAFLWLGEMCEIDLPNNDSNSQSPEQLDPKYKGEYMIVAVGHVITRENYYLNIELANGWEKYEA